MRVVVTPEAREFITAAGGTAYVTPLRRRCCGGALTVLAATTVPPKDAARYEPVGDELLGVRYRRSGLVAEASGGSGGTGGDAAVSGSAGRPGDDASQSPRELLIELRGRLRPHLAACWDGCAYKI